MSNNNIIKESLNINKRNQKQKNQREYNKTLIKKYSNKKNININIKFKKNNNIKKFEERHRHTFRQNSKIRFFDRGQNN